MSAQRQHILFSEAEYYEREDESPTRNEYFHGEIFAMAGAAPRHNIIALNIASSLRSQLRGRPCRTFISDQRIKVETTTLITYPDVAVVCPPFRFDPNNAITLLDATVIVEVLSPSTRLYDAGEKFNNLRELPALRHYLLVEADEMSVEHRFQNFNGDWQSETFAQTEEIVHF